MAGTDLKLRITLQILYLIRKENWNGRMEERLFVCGTFNDTPKASDYTYRVDLFHD